MFWDVPWMFLVLSTANSYISMKLDENSGSITFVFPSKDQHFTCLNFLKYKIWQKWLFFKSKLNNPQFTTSNNSDEKAETGTPFLKKSWFDYLTFHRLSNSKTPHGDIGAYLSLSLCAATLRLHVPWLRCKHQKDCLFPPSIGRKNTSSIMTRHRFCGSVFHGYDCVNFCLFPLC